MTDNDVEQQCPFCFEPWGECEHFELLVELEKEADRNELLENLSKTYGQDDKH